MQKYSVNQQLIQTIILWAESFKIAMQNIIKRMLTLPQQQ